MNRFLSIAFALASLSPMAAHAAGLRTQCDLTCTKERLEVRAEYAQINAWAPATRMLGIQRVADLAKTTQYADVKADAVEAIGKALDSLIPTVVTAGLGALQSMGPQTNNETVDLVSLKALAGATDSWASEQWMPATAMIRQIGVNADSLTTKQEAIKILLDAEFMTDKKGKRKILRDAIGSVLESMK